jgi:hypothetical protein
MARKLLFAFLLVVWLSAVACGMALMWSYNHKPGEAAVAPLRWPSESRLRRTEGRFTLVLLAHPKCPCTRATLEELSKLLAHTAAGRLDTFLLFVQPKGSPEGWHRSDLWNSASSIPGVKVLVDDDGLEANRFDAHVSGQVLLYDENGNLVFHGGITDSRGQIGDNAGRRAIESLVNQGTSDRDQSLVFGCPLFDPDSECRRPNHATLNR